MNTNQAIATAVYTDTYAGNVRAYLIPFKTTRRAWDTEQRAMVPTRLTLYRWVDDTGQECQCTRHGMSAPYMVLVARNNRRFSCVESLS